MVGPMVSSGDKKVAAGVVIGLAGGAIYYMIGPLAYPDVAKEVWWQPVLLFVIAIFVVAIVYYALLHTKREERAMPISLMIVGGLAFFGEAIWLGIINERRWNPSSIPSSDTGWAWAALSNDQINALANKLAQPHGDTPIMIVSATSAGSPLEASIARAFELSHWRRVGTSTIRLSKINGIMLGPDNQLTGDIKSAIQEASNLLVIIDGSIMKSDSAVRLVIGQKAMPNPLPSDRLSEAKDLGERAKFLSNDTLQFLSDRAREQRLLPPTSRELDQLIKFDDETTALYAQRFGERDRVIQSELSMMGMILPWMLVPSRSGSQITTKARWFGAVGEDLAKGDLKSARGIAADDEYWFRQ
jgi:hypothetical protein